MSLAISERRRYILNDATSINAANAEYIKPNVIIKMKSARKKFQEIIPITAIKMKVINPINSIGGASISKKNQYG